MDREDSAKLSRLVTIVSIVFVIGVLYFAKQVLQPLAMAILLTFLLAPVVSYLERQRMWRVPAVFTTIAFAGLILLAIGWGVAGQLVELTGKLPEYQANLSTKIQSVRGADSPVISKASAMVRKLVEEASGSSDRVGQGTAGDSRAPVPVTMVEGAPLPVRLLRDWLGPILSPFATLAIILLFMVFMLIYREDLRDRLIRLAGTGQLAATTQALDEAGRRVSSYLVKLFIVNSTYGLAVSIGLWFIGIPSPFLWGFLAAVLRFIPYVGPWIAAILPIALSLAAYEGWSRPVATIGLFVVLELVSNNIIEPWLYGQGTGVSTVGIIVAALFWTWLWGPLGLVLSLPITVCVTVLGRYTPGLKFVTVLLSDEPALELKLRLYQRLLALDYQEASEIVDKYLKTNSVQDLYTSALLPALSLAELDSQNGRLVDAQRQFIYKFVGDTLEELADTHMLESAGTPESEDSRIVDALAPNQSVYRVLCLPADDEADEVASELVAQCLQAHGYLATALTRETVRAGLETVERDTADAAVISAVAPIGAIGARKLLRRLRSRSSGLSLVVGVWNARGEMTKTRERLIVAGAKGVATNLTEALALLRDMAAAKSRIVATEDELAAQSHRHDDHVT